ncbi:type II toxin-antitoxin system death-on-curing family toxin [Microbacterium oxydans]|uniref:type II toxin-antitoxin system death-on-curing family toxin n=1 Tax=Microbacterium oxydans TaxID=82380 RepID=UPI001143FFBE|nr:type II toxin-antitoxin system death-on-curing family toxin [Microbacterium oxydans]KAB1892938.1 type II toxin-antitoxin system death-on-curing family toxin [Microbacterium oxydans]GED37353.1 death-on-curing protein [Microbacterium oxydans]
MPIEYIEPEQALALTAKLGLHVRDEGLLFSALARPAAGMFGTDAYPAFEEKAAALISSVAQNDALFDGNKRISLYLIFIFIRLNGYEVTFTNDEAFDLVLDVAQSRLDLNQIAQVIAEHIVEDTAH